MNPEMLLIDLTPGLVPGGSLFFGGVFFRLAVRLKAQDS